jgi:hypothetical protein
MMSWFQYICAILLVLLCGFLILLLHQLRNTASAFQRLAESAKDDLRQVATDIHHLRCHFDKLLNLVTDNLELPSNTNSLISKFVQILDIFLNKKHITFLEIIFTSIKFASRFMRKASK